MSKQMLRGFALSAGLLMVPGCFSYIPTEMDAVPPGDHVRLLVTRTGSEELARITESTELRPVVQGQFMGVDQQSLLLQVPVLRDPEGIHRQINQVVRIPEGEVLTVDRREFSLGRTAALVGGGIAVGAFIMHQIFDVFTDQGRGGGDDTQLFIGIFSIGTR